MRRTRLPIHAPCTQDFSAMTGTDVRRFCEECRTHVHDMSDMTEREAEALLARAAGQELCVRYHYGADGSIAFRPEPRAVGLVVALAIAACTGYAEPERLETPEGARVCRDVGGYVIDCALIGEPVVPDEDAPPSPPTLEAEEIGGAGRVVGGTLSGVMGSVSLSAEAPRGDPDASVTSRREARRTAHPQGRAGTVLGQVVE